MLNWFQGKPEEHAVEIHDVRPAHGEPDPFARYFAAICSSGWVDAPHASEQEGAVMWLGPQLRRGA